MNFLEERIIKDGIVKEGNVLKVDSFLNHQMDITLFDQIGKEFKRRFAKEKINKIVTIEASGIGIACIGTPLTEAEFTITVKAPACRPARKGAKCFSRKSAGEI